MAESGNSDKARNIPHENDRYFPESGRPSERGFSSSEGQIMPTNRYSLIDTNHKYTVAHKINNQYRFYRKILALFPNSLFCSI